jgi:acyl-CoA reductase-like NAD-dependent aldehyde dehydrogenase
MVNRSTSTSYGLASRVWTKDICKAHKLAGMIRSVRMGELSQRVRRFSPIRRGGYKQSGWGRKMDGEGLRNYTDHKAVTVKL